MVEINLKEFAKVLTENTNSNQYVWEQTSNTKYRLLLKKGSVVFEKFFTNQSPYYELGFYDTTSLIYKLNILKGNPVYEDYQELFNTIISKNNEKINNAISELFL